MKFNKFLLFSKFLIAAFAANFNLDGLTNEQINHVTAQGIFRSILKHRDFGSYTVKFSEWESPEGDLYVVPSTAENDSDIPALGLGYKFINNDSSVVQSSDIGKVAQIYEERISAAGFPWLWKKHGGDEETADGMLPFGSKKFTRIGLNKKSVASGLIVDDNTDAENTGLFDWYFEDNKDVFDADMNIDNLFDSRHFLFVDVGSRDLGKNEQSLGKREENMVTYITSYTTTTITSTHEVTITATEHPHAHSSDIDHLHREILESKTVDTASSTGYYKHDTSGNNAIHETGIPVTITHEPFVFSTTMIENNPVSLTSPETKVASMYPNSSNNLNENTETTTKTSFEIKGSMPKSMFKSTLTEPKTKSLNNLRTWESYPFLTAEIKSITGSQYYNTTDIVSSFQNFSSSFYGNTTSKTSRGKNSSTYIRNNSTNASTISTSQNLGNNIQSTYLGSLFGLVFAVVSGVILI